MSSSNITGRLSQPGLKLDNPVPKPSPKEGGVGRLGELEVSKKKDANPRLLPDGHSVKRSEESWVDRAKPVGGRAPEDLRNEKAPGFVRIGGEGEPKVYVSAIDKPIERMVDRDGLIRMIGRPPKPDTKLLGFIKIEGSPLYAKALRRIDAFHKAMQEPVPSDPRQRADQAKKLQGLLAEARTALINYSKAHPNNAALRSAVNAAITKMGEEVGLLSSVNLQQNQEFLARHLGSSETFTWASAASLMAGAGEAHMLAYDDSRLDRDRSRDGLGSGINGTVDLVVYDDGSEWVFKPDRLVNPLRDATAEKMGIDLSNPRQGDRIVGTAIVNDLLSPPPKEGDPRPVQHGAMRAIHNGQVGVLVPLARGTSATESRPGELIIEPLQVEQYDAFSTLELQQLKVERLRDVDVALSVVVPQDKLPEDVDGLDSWDLSARYGLARRPVWHDADGNALRKDDLNERGIDVGDEEAQHKAGLVKSIEYRTQVRPLVDDRSRELAARFGAPTEHRDVVYQPGTGRTYRVDTSNPDLRRLLNIQECKDFVTGNHDRHPGNYKLEMGEDGRLARLNAYDDDETFPEYFDERVPSKGYVERDGNGQPIRRNGEEVRSRAGHEVGLPVVMDREFANHLLSLTWEDFRALDGTIPDKALNVAKQRFELLQEHARTLEGEGRLIDRDVDGVNQWEDGSWMSGDGETLQLLLSDPDTSYMGKLLGGTRFGTVDMPGLEPRK